MNIRLLSVITANILSVALLPTISIAEPVVSNYKLVLAQVGPGNRGNVNKSFICTRDGSNYILRTRPNQESRSKVLIPPGRQVILLNNSKIANGFTWEKINFLGATGWVRGDYLCD